MDREQDIAFLRHSIAIAEEARANGNHPFGAVLVDAEGRALLQAGNTFSVDRGPGHAETNLARAAAKRFDWGFLARCTLYTSVEPCCMCAGTIYWAGIGTVVFGLSEATLGALTGVHPDNLTLDLPVRTVFAAGRRDIAVRGPFPELENEVLATHQGFWS